MTAVVQRLGRESYVQKITPNDEPGTIRLDDSNSGFSFGLSLNALNSSDINRADTQNLPVPPELENIADATSPDILPASLDEDLFNEIVTNTFKPIRNPELYQSCGTPKAAADVELRITGEIIETYRQIKLNQQRSTVQSLNGLL